MTKGIPGRAVALTALTAALAACGGTGSSSSPTSTAPPSPTAAVAWSRQMYGAAEKAPFGQVSRDIAGLSTACGPSIPTTTCSGWLTAAASDVQKARTARAGVSFSPSDSDIQTLDTRVVHDLDAAESLLQSAQSALSSGTQPSATTGVMTLEAGAAEYVGVVQILTSLG